MKQNIQFGQYTKGSVRIKVMKTHKTYFARTAKHAAHISTLRGRTSPNHNQKASETVLNV